VFFSSSERYVSTTLHLLTKASIHPFHSSVSSLLHDMQYVTKASSTVRAALKEPAKSKAMAQEVFSYNRSQWVDGQQGAKTMVDGLKAVGK